MLLRSPVVLFNGGGEGGLLGEGVLLESAGEAAAHYPGLLVIVKHLGIEVWRELNYTETS